jgi:hypothetical protein
MNQALYAHMNNKRKMKKEKKKEISGLGGWRVWATLLSSTLGCFWSDTGHFTVLEQQVLTRDCPMQTGTLVTAVTENPAFASCLLAPSCPFFFFSFLRQGLTMQLRLGSSVCFCLYLQGAGIIGVHHHDCGRSF